MIPVPRQWAGETAVIIGAGPSLTSEDVARCREMRTLAIKDAIRLAPWAEVLYGCDRKWWRAHPETESFAGLKYSIEPVDGRPDVTPLANRGHLGLELDPTGLRTGKNSGYQAINLAVHLGVSRILLLGFDMQADGDQIRWFGRHPYERAKGPAPAFGVFLPLFTTLVAPLQAAGVEVINCSRRTALTAFPCLSLEDALAVPA